MAEKLSIESVTATAFGGLRDTRVEIPGTNLVVVHGGNEAGKSTLAELVSWLLVGPSTAKDSAQRFGIADDELRGSLTGHFADLEFDVEARFKLTKRGVSSRSSQVFRYGSELDLEQWRSALGGVDDKVFAGIYRLWGQELHVGDDVKDQLTRVGLGALGGSVDPWKAADDFDAVAKSRATSRAADVVSVAAIERELDEVRTQLSEAARNVESHSRLSAGRDDLKTKLDNARSELGRSMKSQTLLESSSKVLTQFELLAQAELSLTRLDQLSAGWAQVLSDIPRFDLALSDLKSARHELDTAEHDFDQELSRLEPSDPKSARERIAGLKLVASDVDSVLTAINDIRHSRDDVDQASRDLQLSQAALSDSEQKLAVALGVINSDRATVKAAQVDFDSRVSIDGSARACLAAEKAVTDADIAAGEAQVTLTQADAELSSAGDLCVNLGLGPDSANWIGGAGSVGSSRPAAGSYLPSVLVVLLALAAAAVGQWPLAAGGLVVALVTAIWNFRAPSKAGSNSDSSYSSVASQASQKYRDKSEALGLAAAGMKAAEERCDQTRGSSERASKSLCGLVGKLGLGLPTDPNLIKGALKAWTNAQELLTGVETAEADLQRAVEDLARAEGDDTDRSSTLKRLFSDSGLPEGVAPEAAHSVAQSYLQASIDMSNIRNLNQHLDECTTDWETVLSPVSADIAERSLDWISDTAKEMVGLSEVRAKASAAVKQVEGTIEQYLQTDSELAALVDELGTSPNIDMRTQRLADEITSIEADVTQIAGDLRLSEQGIKNLAGESKIADLRADQGSKWELQAEVAFESAANMLAGVLARQVAEEFERKHQPDVVTRTAHLATEVAGDWAEVIVKPSDSDGPRMLVRRHDGGEVPVTMLSTGARALLYLSLRLAMADHDGDNRRAEMPLLCDDPLVHLDDQRAERAVRLLADAAERRQVIIFTCHRRTVEAAVRVGAQLVEI